MEGREEGGFGDLGTAGLMDAGRVGCRERSMSRKEGECDGGMQRRRRC